METFQTLLTEKISQSGLQDLQLCQKANLSRQQFLKVRGTGVPSKRDLLSLLTALELPLSDMEAILRAAGYDFQEDSPFDCILKYYISQGVFHIYTINLTLFAYNQPQLGES